jgi:hypothetical protein
LKQAARKLEGYIGEKQIGKFGANGVSQVVGALPMLPRARPEVYYRQLF